jgi:GNAT superfamily N-acetyltransferase
MMEIVRAQPQDAPLLKEIAVASKGHWGYPEQLMAEWARTPIVTAEAIASNLVYVARSGPAVVGWYCLRLEPAPATLEDLWVLPALIGRGTGRALFRHAASQARRHGATTFQLDAEPNAVGFYERMGCHVTGRTLSEWGRYIPRMRCDLLLDDGDEPV